MSTPWTLPQEIADPPSTGQLRRAACALGVACARLVAAACAFGALRAAEPPGLLLRYEAPARNWLEALPVGNGRLGGMVFGGGAEERIQLNEGSLWSGSPQAADNPASLEALPEVRRLLFAGQFAAAEALCRKSLVCKGPGTSGGNAATAPYGCYQTLGDLRFTQETPQVAIPGPPSSVPGHHRSLDLTVGVARTAYSLGGVRFEREVFSSHPDQVLVVRWTASAPGALTFGASLTRSEAAVTTAEEPGGLLLSGQLHDGRQPGAGMRFAARLRIVPEGGKVHIEGNSLRVEKANAATLILAAATDRGEQDPDLVTSTRVASSLRKNPPSLREAHVADHRALFGRVELSLGGEEARGPTTLARLERVSKGEPDVDLEALCFHYGRYLLIASSRPGGLPANLQGLWADSIQTPWNGDYHTNINLQMNYWPAEPANLPECVEPLVDLIDAMRGPGSRTAKVHYGARGWVVHSIHNVWGYTSPGEHPSWGLSPTSGPWLAQHLWEVYSFSRDPERLRRVWPALRESAEFCLDWLVEDPHTGKLVSGPATSPENVFITADGQRASITMGPSMDQEIIWDLFTNVLEGAQVLGGEDQLVERVEKARARLLLPGIGSDGRLLEWAQELREAEPTHRHVSHLFGLHPGRQFTTATPELLEACRKSLVARGDSGTGWSMAWKVNFWARLRDGDHAERMLRNLLRLTGEQGFNMSNGGGVHANLFCAHPPFQIDGNFGATAGIVEMLLQSHAGEIDLLPALPSAWPDGRVKGLRARGGVEVGIEWRAGKLTAATLSAARSGKHRLRIGASVREVELEAGKVHHLTP